MTKRVLFFVLALALVSTLALAQEATTGTSIDPDKLAALLVFVGGGIVTAITGILKSLLKATGTLAVILTGVVAVAATAIYFLFIDPMTPSFNVLAFVLYAVVVFGQATGFFHFYKKVTPTQ
jgi:hypothetical protein